MMGIKTREFAPLPDLSLEEFVSKDNFYRHLEERLDLSFVRDLVAPLYAVGGRASVDPVVFFKLQLILFFEGLRSERQLMEVVADRLSLRWYAGYDLHEPLPDHSSLTKIRERYGVEIFRRFFEQIVGLCIEAGLVKGRELFFDSTKVEADADMDSLAPRWFVEAHLGGLFEGGSIERSDEDSEGPQVEELTDNLPTAGDEDLIKANSASEDWIKRNGRQDRSFQSGPRKRVSDTRASRTDPDASPTRFPNSTRKLGYQTHYVIDGGKSRIILSALVTPGEVTENRPMLDLLWRTCFRWKLYPHHVTGDGKYGTIENIASVEEAGIRAYMALHEAGGRGGFFLKSAFTYDTEKDLYLCPAGEKMRPMGDAEEHRRQGRIITYRAGGAVCAACSLKPQCTINKNGRSLRRGPRDEYIDRLKAYMQTEPYRKAIRKRKVWIEPLFAEGKQWHGMRRFRLRTLGKVNTEALMIAAGQNIKRLLAVSPLKARSEPAQQKVDLRLPPPIPTLEVHSPRVHRRAWRPTQALFNTQRGFSASPNVVAAFSRVRDGDVHHLVPGARSPYIPVRRITLESATVQIRSGGGERLKATDAGEAAFSERLRGRLDAVRPLLGSVFLVAYAISALASSQAAAWVFVGSGLLLYAFSIPWANPFHRGMAAIAAVALGTAVATGSFNPAGFLEGLPTYYGIVAVLLVLTVAGYPIRAPRFEQHVGDLLAAMSRQGVGLKTAGGGLGHLLGVALDVGSFVLVDAFSRGASREERLGTLVAAGRGFSFIPMWANLNIMTATTITLTGVTYPALLAVALPFVIPGMGITLLVAQRGKPPAEEAPGGTPSREAALVPLYPLLLVAAVAVTGSLFPTIQLTTVIALTVAVVVAAIALAATLKARRLDPAKRLARETRTSLSASHNEFALFGSAGILVLSLTQLGVLEPIGELFSALPLLLVAPALAVAMSFGFIAGVHVIPMVLLVDAAFPLDAAPSPALWAVAILLGAQSAIMITPFSSSVTMISRLTGRHPFEVGPGRNWRFCLVSALCGLAYLGLLSALLL